MTPIEAIYDMEKEKLHTYTATFYNKYGQEITPTNVELVNAEAWKTIIYPRHKRLEIYINTARK